MWYSHSSFAPLACPSQHAGGYSVYLLAGDFTASETPQAEEGGLDCILCPWRAECWQLGPEHHGEGFWGMHLFQEVLHPSKTSAFKIRLHMFRKEIALCREAQKMFRKLVTVGDPNFSTVSCRRWQLVGTIPIKRTNRWWGPECENTRSGKQGSSWLVLWSGWLALLGLKDCTFICLRPDVVFFQFWQDQLRSSLHALSCFSHSASVHGFCSTTLWQLICWSLFSLLLTHFLAEAAVSFAVQTQMFYNCSSNNHKLNKKAVNRETRSPTMIFKNLFVWR